MRHLVQAVDSPQEIAEAASRLRVAVQQNGITPKMILDVFESWAGALDTPELRNVGGLPFLRLWLRRGTLEPVLIRELGPDSLGSGCRQDGRARLRAFPVGIVGHWPAGNIETQPILSLTCALLGGNGCLVRVPSESVGVTRLAMEKLQELDCASTLTDRISMFTFDHDRTDLHEAMARAVDGAMIWGGAEAVLRVRTLPFPYWTRIAVFGPRVSMAGMDSGTWADPGGRRSWCRRIARDVWQFDQQACSSPQALFLEACPGANPRDFLHDLGQALREENTRHPRTHIHPALASAICLARGAWLLEDPDHDALFPQTPDWTLLLGSGSVIPKPTQGRTVSVLVVNDLLDVISRFDGTVQTLGLAVSDPQREEKLALAAGLRGVDRVVRLGSMHTFNSPWDGTDLIRPMVRLVRHLPSHN